MIRKLLARLSIAIAPALPVPAKPVAPVEPIAQEDPASWFEFEVHLGAHRPDTRPVTAEEYAQAWQAAEAHWQHEYRNLARQLRENTRRARERQHTLTRI
jgi:hypothetical protein